jgi:hypothetical protein
MLALPCLAACWEMYCWLVLLYLLLLLTPVLLEHQLHRSHAVPARPHLQLLRPLLCVASWQLVQPQVRPQQ